MVVNRTATPPFQAPFPPPARRGRERVGALSRRFPHRHSELLHLAGPHHFDLLRGADRGLAKSRIEVLEAIGYRAIQGEQRVPLHQAGFVGRALGLDRHNQQSTLLIDRKVAFRLPGRPIASTIWPGLRPSTFARGIAGADNPSTLRRARSVAGSRPTSVAFKLLSSTATVMSSSCSTTWLAVRTRPLSQTMPVPARPRRASTRTTLLLALSTSASISFERSLRELIF